MPRVEKEVLIADPIDSTTRGVVVGEVDEMGDVQRSSSGFLTGDLFNT